MKILTAHPRKLSGDNGFVRPCLSLSRRTQQRANRQTGEAEPRQSRSDPTRRWFGRNPEALCRNVHRTSEREACSADPTFEAILNNASANGAEVVKVPLTATYAHDLPKMLSCESVSLIYICNPEQPDRQHYAKDELRDFIAKTSLQTTIL
jgi:hypothetical protein